MKIRLLIVTIATALGLVAHPAFAADAEKHDPKKPQSVSSAGLGSGRVVPDDVSPKKPVSSGTLGSGRVTPKTVAPKDPKSVSSAGLGSGRAVPEDIAPKKPSDASAEARAKERVAPPEKKAP